MYSDRWCTYTSPKQWPISTWNFWAINNFSFYKKMFIPSSKKTLPPCTFFIAFFLWKNPSQPKSGVSPGELLPFSTNQSLDFLIIPKPPTKTSSWDPTSFGSGKGSSRSINSSESTWGLLETFQWQSCPGISRGISKVTYFFRQRKVAGFRGFQWMEIKSNGCFPGGCLMTGSLVCGLWNNPYLIG